MKIRALDLLLLLAATAPANAQVITTLVSFRPYFGAETTFNGGDTLPITNFSENHPSFPSYQFTGQAQASGSFAGGPVLRAMSRMRGTDVPHTIPSPQPFSLRTNAVVTFVDHPTVTSLAVPVGSPITVTMTYSITGFFMNESIVVGNPLPATGGAALVQNQPSYNFGTAPTFTSSYSVTNGALYDYSLSLFVNASGPTNVPMGFPNTYSSAGLSDYSNTVLLTGLSFTDDLGMPIGATLTSENGFTYAAAPEPSALLLVAGAVSAWAARRSTRRKS